MNKFFLLILLFCTQLGLANASQKSVSCVLQGLKDPISFVVPSKDGDLPQIDFPVKAQSLNSSSMFLIRYLVISSLQMGYYFPWTLRRGLMQSSGLTPLCQLDRL